MKNGRTCKTLSNCQIIVFNIFLMFKDLGLLFLSKDAAMSFLFFDTFTVDSLDCL